MLDDDFKLWIETIQELAKNSSDLEGDFVECGVFLGTSARVIAQECKTTLHLFDSWEGVSELSEVDNELYKTLTWKADLDIVKINLSYSDNVQYYKGWFPERFPEISDKKISFLHLDCSLYQPTKDSLESFWDQMVPGGRVVCNTHEGLSTGPEKAVREFFAGKAELIQYPMGILVAIK